MYLYLPMILKLFCPVQFIIGCQLPVKCRKAFGFKGLISNSPNSILADKSIYSFNQHIDGVLLVYQFFFLGDGIQRQFLDLFEQRSD